MELFLEIWFGVNYDGCGVGVEVYYKYLGYVFFEEENGVFLGGYLKMFMQNYLNGLYRSRMMKII